MPQIELLIALPQASSSQLFPDSINDNSILRIAQDKGPGVTPHPALSLCYVSNPLTSQLGFPLKYIQAKISPHHVPVVGQTTLPSPRLLE